jgi:hypothetical protein
MCGDIVQDDGIGEWLRGFSASGISGGGLILREVFWEKSRKKHPVRGVI